MSVFAPSRSPTRRRNSSNEKPSASLLERCMGSFGPSGSWEARPRASPPLIRSLSVLRVAIMARLASLGSAVRGFPQAQPDGGVHRGISIRHHHLESDYRMPSLLIRALKAGRCVLASSRVWRRRPAAFAFEQIARYPMRTVSLLGSTVAGGGSCTPRGRVGVITGPGSYHGLQPSLL